MVPPLGNLPGSSNGASHTSPGQATEERRPGLKSSRKSEPCKGDTIGADHRTRSRAICEDLADWLPAFVSPRQGSELFPSFTWGCAPASLAPGWYGPAPLGLGKQTFLVTSPPSRTCGRGRGVPQSCQCRAGGASSAGTWGRTCASRWPCHFHRRGRSNH